MGQQIFILATLILVTAGVCTGQKLSTRYSVSENDDAACELNSRHIDTLVMRAKETGDRIFIISRLGKGEKGNILERARLVQAFSLLVDVKSVEPEKIVQAIGYPTSGFGGATEFYMGSELFLVSFAKKGKTPCLQVYTATTSSVLTGGFVIKPVSNASLTAGRRRRAT